jgi:hypothetical protein
MNYPLTKEVWVEGDITRIYWTFRALARAGYRVVENAKVVIRIEEDTWLVNDKRFTTIKNLLNELEQVVK